MKRIRMTDHAREQARERGTNADEIETAIRGGTREPAKKDRWLYKHNFEFRKRWQGTYYAIKQVAPIVAERQNEFVVITVYTFYF